MRALVALCACQLALLGLDAYFLAQAAPTEDFVTIFVTVPVMVARLVALLVAATKLFPSLPLALPHPLHVLRAVNAAFAFWTLALLGLLVVDVLGWLDVAYLASTVRGSDWNYVVVALALASAVAALVGQRAVESLERVYIELLSVQDPDLVPRREDDLRDAGLLKRLSFDYVTPLVFADREPDDPLVAYHLLDDDAALDAANRAVFALNRMTQRSLAGCVRTVFWPDFLSLALWRLVLLVARIVTVAVALPLALDFVQDKGRDRNDELDARTTVLSFLSATGIFVALLVQVIAKHRYRFEALRLALRMRGAYLGVVLDSALSIRLGGLQQNRVIELVAGDLEKVSEAAAGINEVWASSLEVFITMGLLLVVHLEWATATGAGVLLLVVVAQIGAGGRLARASRAAFLASDRRVKHLAETLANIDYIRRHNLIDVFRGRLSALRHAEVRSLRSLLLLQYFARASVGHATFVAAMASILTIIIAYDDPFESEAIFAALALFYALPQSLRGLTIGVEAVRVASAVLDRTRFLAEGPKVPPKPTLFHRPEQARVEIFHGFFSWRPEADFASPMFALQDVSLAVQSGALALVVGPAGSGKSSLLMAILGEMRRTDGDLEVAGDVAYVAQQPLVLPSPATVQDNILFGLSMDRPWYDQVAAATGLVDTLPAGDLMRVSPALSSVHRMQIAVARAVYARKDIVLLDGVLDELPAAMATNMFLRVCRGLLRERVVVLTTRRPLSCFSECEKALTMTEGRIGFAGSFVELVADGRIAKPGTVEEGDTGVEVAEAAGVSRGEEEGKEEQGSEGGLDAPLLSPDRATLKRHPRSWLLVYGVLFLMIVSQFARVFSDALVSWWVRDGVFSDVDDATFVLILCSCVLVVVSMRFAMMVLVYGAAGDYGQRVHDEALDAVVQSERLASAPQVMSHFVGGLEEVDRTLPVSAMVLLLSTSATIAALGVFGVVVPLALLVVPPVALLVVRIARRSFATARPLEVLADSAVLEVYHKIGWVLGNLASIRASSTGRTFYGSALALADRHHRVLVTRSSVAAWQGVRTDVVALAVVFLATVLAILSTDTHPALCGLVLIYALELSRTVEALLDSFWGIEAAQSAASDLATLGSSAKGRGASGLTQAEADATRWLVDHRGWTLHFGDADVVVETGAIVGVVGARRAVAATEAARVDGQRPLPAAAVFVMSGTNGGPWFTGSIRFNVDPSGAASDAEIWNALERLKIKGNIEKQDAGLGAMSVDPEALPLLIVARGLLRRPAVVVLEAVERRIVDAWRTGLGGAGTIVIVQSEGCAEACDRVVSLDY